MIATLKQRTTKTNRSKLPPGAASELSATFDDINRNVSDHSTDQTEVELLAFGLGDLEAKEILIKSWLAQRLMAATMLRDHYAKAVETIQALLRRDDLATVDVPGYE